MGKNKPNKEKKDKLRKVLKDDNVKISHDQIDAWDIEEETGFQQLSIVSVGVTINEYNNAKK